jgi:hypothetical protein
MTINKKNAVFFLLTLVLIIIVGFRPLEKFADTENYVEMSNSIDDFFGAEPTFFILNRINKIVFNGYTQTLFLIYAAFGVCIKMAAIKKMSIYPFFSIFIYICTAVVLQEMTAIRAGVAIAVFLYAIPDVVNKRLSSYIFKTLIAIMFHYSAIVMLPIYLLNSERINIKRFIIFPLIGIFFSAFPNLLIYALDVLGLFSPFGISEKIRTYIMLLEDDVFTNFNWFNPYILSLFVFYLLCLSRVNKINRIASKYSIVFIKILAIQLFSFYFFSAVPVFAWRIAQFFSIGLIVLIPDIIATFRNKTIPIIFAVSWLLFSLYSFTYKYTFIFNEPT